MIEEIKKIKSDKSDLRKFGITMAIVLGILGLVLLWKARESWWILLSISGFFLLFGLALPIVLKPIHKFWMTLAHILGWIMTRVILSVIFFVVFTLIGWIARLFGKRFLDQKFEPSASTYWISRDHEEARSTEAYERQF